jgi:mono/diheme cytochrome c family protein
MRDQPRVEAFDQSAFFEDRLSARPRPADTVARGQLQLDNHLYTGRANGQFAQTFPFTVTLQVLQRGQERYNIFCSPCHGLVGDGQGIIPEYGLRRPDSFHTPELHEQPPGYYFDLISRGTRVMPSYASRIRPEDRWAIIAYIRALQLSQNADLSQVPPQEIPNLE